MKNCLITYYKCLIILSVFLSACGGGDSKDNPPKVTNIDISKLNPFANQYTMISAQPSSKPESNSAPSATYNFTLTSVAGSFLAPSMLSSEISQENSLIDKNPIYGTGQIACDNMMRQREHELLLTYEIPSPKKLFTNIYSSSAPSSISLNESWEDVYIYHYNGTALSLTTIDTHCRHISTYAYFFIDDAYTTDMSSLLTNTYGPTFDSIYLKNHQKFGNENDYDENGKIIIVFSPQLTNGLLGYFNSSDKYPYNSSTNPDSNEGDIFYITTDFTGDKINATLAHEFQHMIYFDEHVNRKVTNTYTWLNEALSQAAEYYNGYDTAGSNHINWIANFLHNYTRYPVDNIYTGWEGLSLTHWTSSNYGYGALFIRYLIDQYDPDPGNPTYFTKNLCQTNKVGIAAVEAATGVDFNTTFNNFTKAIVLSDVLSNTNTLYQFINPPLDLEDVQSTSLNGRRGLTTAYTASAGASATWWLYPYEIWFVDWSGTFKSMTITGNNIVSTPIGY